MAILWCGGEDIDFPTNPLVGLSGFRAGYARCSLSASAGTMRSVAFGPLTSLWMSMQVSGNNLAASVRMFGLMNSGANSGLWVGSSAASATKIALIKYYGVTATATELAAETLNSWAAGNVTGKLDVEVVNYGASAAVTVFWNGAAVIAFSGNAAVPDMTDIDQAAQTGNSGATSTVISEVVIADQDTRAFSLVTLAPNAAGTTDNWTGAFTDVNETTVNDATVVSTNTATQDEQFNLTDLPSGAFAIKAVKEAMRAANTAGAAATDVALGINSGGSVDAGSPAGLTTAFATYERLMLVNPVTGIAFTTAEINALQVNLRSS
jgi:hypothetical protein